MKRIFSILLALAMCISTLPVLAAEEPVINSDFEDGDARFAARGQVAVAVSGDAAYSGSSSLLVSGRGSNGWEGASLNIANSVKLDETYYGQMYVKAADEGASFTVKLSLELTDDSKTDYPQIGTAKVNSSTWTLIEGSWTADYTGNLKTLNLNIETDDDGIGKSFYVDNVFFAHDSVPKPSVVTAPPPEEEKAYISYAGNTIFPDILNRDYDDIDKLISLGVVNGYPDGTFGPDNSVTRAEFLAMLMRMLKLDTLPETPVEYTDVPDDHYAKNAIAVATNMGICSGYGDGLFGPDDHVTYAQAVKMLISTIGYAHIAERSGGYPNGYIAAANGEDITLGAIPADTELTRAMTAELLCCALDVSMYMKDGLGNIVLEKDKTILTEYYDGDIERGYVSSSSESSVTVGREGLDTVIIDGTSYRAGKTRASELVGYNVEYIYTEENGDPELLYIRPREMKTNELVIDSRDIEKYADYEYTYYDGNDREKTARLDRNFTVIYNGQTLSGGYDLSMMTPELGSVKLIGSDESSRYGTVYVTSYDIFIVSSINKATGDAYDVNNKKYTFKTADKNLKIINPDGSAGEIADIREDDVLHIMSTASGDATTVQIMRSSVSGVVNGESDEDITIDGMRYVFSDVFINRGFGYPEVGADVTVYLDINGDVVYVDEQGSSSMSVGYLINAFTKTGGRMLQMYYLDSSGSLVTTNVSSNIVIDGAAYKGSDMDAVLRTLRGSASGDDTESRIFRYALNGSGEIHRIDFARAQRATANAAEAAEGENTLYTVNDKYISDGASTKYKFKYNAKTFIDENGGYSSIALSPGTTIFLVPEDIAKAESSDYEVVKTSSLGYDEQYKVFAYKTKTDGITVDYAVLVRNGKGAANLRSQTGYVVTRVFKGVNGDGESVPGFEVYMNGGYTIYMVSEADVYSEAVAANDGADIAPGDIIRFDTDSANEISNLAVDKGSGKYGDYFYSAKGYIYFKDDGYAYFTTKRPSASSDLNDMVLIPLDSFDITVYSKETKKAYSGVAGDVIDYTTDPENYSTVYITMNYENAKSLICVTDY